MPSPTQQILDGINGTVYPIAAADASPAFESAILNLPASGGELYVYPPATAGDKYVFETSVLVRRPNVTMRFAPGTLLDFTPSSTASSIFNVPLRNFRCHSAHVRHSIGAATTNRSIFLVRDRVTAQSSNTAAFYDCVFDVEQATTAPIESFSCIRAEGLVFRKGLLVHRCRFLFRPGMLQPSAWSANGNPMGACAVRAIVSQGTLMTGNTLRGAVAGSKGACGALAVWDCGEYSIFGENLVQELRLPDQGSAAVADRSCLVRMQKTDCGEGHHSFVTCCLFDECEVDYALSLKDAFYEHLTGNDFGNLNGHCVGVVSAARGPLVLCANGVHGLAHADPSKIEGVYSLREVHEVAISAGVVTETPRAYAHVVTGGPSRNIHVSPHQVVRLGT